MISFVYGTFCIHKIQKYTPLLNINTDYLNYKFTTYYYYSYETDRVLLLLLVAVVVVIIICQSQLQQYHDLRVFPIGIWHLLMKLSLQT